MASHQNRADRRSGPLLRGKPLLCARDSDLDLELLGKTLPQRGDNPVLGRLIAASAATEGPIVVVEIPRWPAG